MKQLHIHIPDEWHDWLTDQCQSAGMTKSGFVKMLFFQFNGGKGPQVEKNERGGR